MIAGIYQREAKPGSFIDPFRRPPLKGPFDDILPPLRRGPGQMKPLPLVPGVRLPATWKVPLPPI